MIRSFLHRATRRFERTWNYDATYIHEIIDADANAGFRLNLLSPIAHYQADAPAPLWHGAALASILDGDCGPCAQLTIDGALAAGVDEAVIAALLRRDFDRAGMEAGLGFRYAEAVLKGDLEADELRGQIEHRYGQKALIAVAFATATIRVYPVLKRALGHGAACHMLKVGKAGDTVLQRAA